MCTELRRSRYRKFHRIVNAEMKKPVTIYEIVNQDYCASTLNLPSEDEFNKFTLNPNQVFSGLNGKVGIYQLWEETGYCGDHQDQRKIECTYVGKTGSRKVSVSGRIKNHLKDKWRRGETMYVTYYSCINRTAKYLEQVLLDVYKFEHNGHENPGREVLEVMYPEELLLHGTGLHEISEMMAKAYPEDFCPDEE